MKCKIEKSFENFGKNKTKIDGYTSHCKLCISEYNKKWYLQNSHIQKSRVYPNTKIKRDNLRKIIKKYLEKHPCVDCGFKDTRALEFDHIRGIKKFNIADAPGRMTSVTTLYEEINKCEVRCSNCHKILTAIRRNIADK